MADMLGGLKVALNGRCPGASDLPSSFATLGSEIGGNLPPPRPQPSPNSISKGAKFIDRRGNAREDAANRPAQAFDSFESES